MYILFAIIDKNKNNSPGKFKQGGKDKFEEQNINHQNLQIGIIEINPLFIIILRVIVRL